MGREKLQRLAIGGGVAANSELRASLAELAGALGVRLWTPPLELCTDNAAMIGAAARFTPALPVPRVPGARCRGQAGRRPGWRRVRLVLYGKAGCCLCDEARAAVAEAAADYEFALEEVDVALDPVLCTARYGERIPVLSVDGHEELELGFDARAVREVLGRVDA